VSAIAIATASGERLSLEKPTRRELAHVVFKNGFFEVIPVGGAAR